MMHRIRLALSSGSFKKNGDAGPVETDETSIDGKPKNMHADRRMKLRTAMTSEHKTAVMGMIDRETRGIRAKVIPNVKRETLQAEILANLQHKATVYTDGWLAMTS